MDHPTEDAVTLDLLRVVVTRLRQAHELRLWEMEAIDQYGGPQGLIGDLARLQRADTPERLARLLARLAAYPTWMEAHRANVEAGLAAGRTAAAPVVERCITQTRRMLETPPEASPIVLAHATLGEDVREALTDAVRRHVRPAHAAWLAMLERYAGHVRAGDGICHLPDGDAALPPPHPRLDDARRGSRARPRVRPASASPRSRPRSGASRRSSTRATSASCDGSWTPARTTTPASRPSSCAPPRNSSPGPRLRQAGWFGRLPGDGCGVRAVEPHMEQEAPPAFYVPPSEDGSRRGVYYINTFDPASRPLHRLPATTFHEAVPGHHFQIAIEQELRDLPSLPALRLTPGGRCLRGGLGPLRGAAGGRDGPLRGPAGTLRGARIGGLARGAAGRRHRHPRPGLDAPAVHRPVARAGRPVAPRGGDGDRPLHQLAGPGALLHDRTAGDPGPAGRPRASRRRRGSTCAHSTTRPSGTDSLPLSTLRAQLPGWVKPRADA